MRKQSSGIKNKNHDLREWAKKAIFYVGSWQKTGYKGIREDTKGTRTDCYRIMAFGNWHLQFAHYHITTLSH
jgi:hypothetical protein